MHGYPNIEDYYKVASSIHLFKQIKNVKTLVLVAKDDIIIALNEDSK